MIQAGALHLKISVNQKQAEQCAMHACEMLRWNQSCNLTTITDPFEIVVKHYLDSLAPAVHLPPQIKLLDIGSGAGFPGLPLKIIRPDLQVTLVETVRKKVSFLNHVIRIMGLNKIKAVQIRVPSAQLTSHFDVIICRALTDLDTFIAMGQPLLAPQAKLIAMKGKIKSQKLSELHNLSMTIRPYSLPFMDAQRCLIIACNYDTMS